MSTIISVPHLGGKSAAVLFGFVLFSFVIESQLTQYVQSDLGFRQPYFIFYIVHSALWIIFPLHLTYLALFTDRPVREYCDDLSIAIKQHLLPQTRATVHSPFPLHKFSRIVLFLTVGISVPGLLWFSAVSLAPLSDVTAIWNTNAFWVYIMTVKLFKLQWDRKRLFAVVIATLGVMAVIYGGSSTNSDLKELSIDLPPLKKYAAPLIGDLMTFAASLGYAAYQVLYKRNATLPSDPEHEGPFYNQVSASDDSISVSSDALDPERPLSISESTIYPPAFGLHPNLLSSLAGLVTLLVLWIPIPILHYFGTEKFQLPPDFRTAVAIGGIALSGVFFNAGFMVLIGVWGPVVASIGNLLTIVLIFISDIMLGNALESLSIWNVLGAAAIVAAFGILAQDVLQIR